MGEGAKVFCEQGLCDLMETPEGRRYAAEAIEYAENDGFIPSMPVEAYRTILKENGQKNKETPQQVQTSRMSVSSSTVRLEGKFDMQSVIDAMCRLLAPEGDCIVEIFISAKEPQ